MSILLLTRSDLARLATPTDYQQAVCDGFRRFAEGRVQSPSPMELPAMGGAFHVKGAVARDSYAAVKVNGNFPDNPARHGLPTIQGMLLLFDAATGSPLAIMDSAEVTLRRTAAASAAAVDPLANRDAETILFWGCGVQGRAHAEAIAPLRRFQRMWFHDIDPAKAERLADEFGPAAKATGDPRSAAVDSDIIVTTTVSRAPLAIQERLRPGAFIAAVGADNPHKNEIPPEFMARAAIVTDVTDQCVVMGDLRAAIAAGLMTRDDVRAELGSVLAGAATGRRDERETVIFDSTGAAFQDLAAAAMIFERAKAAGIGASLDLKR